MDNNNSDYESILDSKRQNNFEQDSDDILHKISQISSSDNKSFDSPIVFSKTGTLFRDFNTETDNIGKEPNIIPFISLEEKSIYKNNNIKNENILDEENNILISNKQLNLNQKLKYLCSLIQISNINIHKYDDLKQFNKYLVDKNSILNLFEPINILFGVINELIFVIQKELRNNDILMKELKRHRYIRKENENQIYKLKIIIKDKDKELDELRNLKKDDYFKYSENEINELKNENKELNKKINTYKFQIKKIELDNNEMKNRLKSFNNEKIRNKNRPQSNLNNLLKNNSNNIIPNIYTVNDINNNNSNNNTLNINNKDKIKKDIRSSMKKYKTNNSNISYNKSINKKRNFSASKNKDMNIKNISQNNDFTSYNNINNNNDIDNSNNNNYNNNGRSIIANLMFLLKEINEMLNVYNSSLSKITINKNDNLNINDGNKNNNKNIQVFEENNNIKTISNDFFNKINNAIINIKKYMKEENMQKLNNNKKLIYVNTSKWKNKKKSHNINKRLNNFDNNEENKISAISLTKRNVKNKINLKLINKCNFINNEEDNDNKLIEDYYTHSNIASSVNTEILFKNINI